MEEEEATNSIYGIYFQETLRPTDRLIADIGFRYDRMKFDVDTDVYREYNWGTGQYVDVADYTESVDKVFHLYSPSIGLTYALTDELNVYASAAESDQVPSESEIQDNGGLEASTARNYEVGLKGRAESWAFDLAVYKTRVEDEIVSVYNGAWTEYENAGETDKFGVEFAGRIELMNNLWLGGSYAYSDYEFKKLMEPVTVYGMGPPVTTNINRSGNQMPYVPRHQYSLSLDYSHPSGFKGRVQADTWGSYYMDNANTEKYGGYDFVTNLMLGYDKGPHSIALNVDNVFDKHYSVEAKKDTRGTKTYAGASPRIAMLTYTYSF
jgi:iron complex outermembrane receptor protein